MKKIREYLTSRDHRIRQGDIFHEVECVRNIVEANGILQIEKVLYPFVVVLSQDCDLAQDFNARLRYESREISSQDKFLQTILVAPIYNAEHLKQGEHLSDLEISMRQFPGKSEWSDVCKNKIARYHYLEFPEYVPIINSVVDFKHFFTVSVSYLNSLRVKNFICSINSIYRESLCQRFSFFLSRIALPD